LKASLNPICQETIISFRQLAGVSSGIAALKSQLEQPQKIYNERGAGRKTKITNEMVIEVLMLRQE
jgi:hypothetical protein